MQTLDESRLEAQQMSQDEEDRESESVRSDATTEENDEDEGVYKWYAETACLCFVASMVQKSRPIS